MRMEDPPVLGLFKRASGRTYNKHRTSKRLLPIIRMRQGSWKTSLKPEFTAYPARLTEVYVQAEGGDTDED